MKPEYIKKFEDLGMGMFCHFGLYSTIGKGEWHYTSNECDREHYFEAIKNFKIPKNWAKQLVKTAKDAGAKYITLTTRHHEGFSLFDTCGVNEFDAPHSPTGRDLVREFVDECNKQGIVPFFYHTLLDWHVSDYKDNFDAYIDYLIKSVEILCKNYGKIGGLWFDGYWDKPNANWQFERLYATIRKYQPEAMIINNTGLSALGEVTNYEIDSVTFERGKPTPVSNSDGKDRAGEMCDGITDHWGYCKDDICVKSAPYLISSLIDCRKFNCNYLINVGPNEKGMVNPVEKYTLKAVGYWIKRNKNFIYKARRSDVEAENAIIMQDDKYYYAITKDVPMQANENVARAQNRPCVTIKTDKKIKNLVWLDDGKKIALKDDKKTFEVIGYPYGHSLYARVARFKL